MKNACLLFIVFAVFTGCSRSFREKNYVNCQVSALADIAVDKHDELKAPPALSKPLKKDPVNLQTHEKKIIKDGKIGLLADSVEMIRLALSQEVRKFGGYVAV